MSLVRTSLSDAAHMETYVMQVKEVKFYKVKLMGPRVRGQIRPVRQFHKKVCQL